MRDKTYKINIHYNNSIVTVQATLGIHHSKTLKDFIGEVLRNRYIEWDDVSVYYDKKYEHEIGDDILALIIGKCFMQTTIRLYIKVNDY